MSFNIPKMVGHWNFTPRAVVHPDLQEAVNRINASKPRYTCPHCDWAGSNDHAVWMAHHCSKPPNALARQEGGGPLNTEPCTYIGAAGLIRIEVHSGARFEQLRLARRFIDLLIDLEGKAP